MNPVKSKLNIRLRMIGALLLAFLEIQYARPTPQQQARDILEEVAATMGGLEALEGVGNITRVGTLQQSALGQAPDPAKRVAGGGRPNPYKQIIDFTGRREVGLSGPREIPTVADWEKGGYRNVFGMALRPLEPDQLENYKGGWDRDIVKFPLHALSEKSRLEGVSEERLDGQPHDVVTLQFVDGLKYRVYVNRESRLISRMDYTEDHNPYGDVPKERTFADYRAVDKLKLPFQETTRALGETIQAKAWSEISVNGALPDERFEIPENLRERAKEIGHAHTTHVLPSKLADGVWFGESMHMNNMWVEFQDFVVVVEGPGNEMHSQEVLRQVRETVGNKPIRYLITTHHHSDHTGGIRGYAAAGATVVTHSNNEAAIREVLTRPHTVQPDSLARAGGQPKIETVKERHTISDGKRTIELMHVPNPHASGYLAVFLPRERILFESDMFQIQGDRWQIVLNDKPAVPPEGIALYEAVTKAGWRPQQIVPGHGILLPWKLMVDTVRAAKSQASSN